MATISERTRDRIGSGWTLPLLALTALSLLWIYLFGIEDNPARWEEPRRCLVAMEMIASGDYVVPTVMGELYLKKPPLYNWLIALAAGNRFEAADAPTARWVTIGALVLIGLLLWRLGAAGSRDGPSLLPVVIFLSMPVVIQLGRAGEIDIVFALFTTAALGSFEFGRRRDSPTLQWIVPQIFVGAGVLTKGIAPLFFYPPVLYCVWKFRGRIRFSPVAFVLGLAAMGLVVAAWIVPYSRSVPVSHLEGSGASELLWVIRKAGLRGTLLHPIKYPLMVLGSVMPWTVYLFAMGRDFRRELRETLRDDPYSTLATATVFWGILLYVFIPGVASRYLIPVLPFAAIWIAGAIERGRETGRAERRLSGLSRRWWFWTLAVLMLIGYALGGGKGLLDDPAIGISVVVGLTMIAGMAYLVYRRGLRSSVVPLLLSGLLYGAGFSGVWEARRSAKTTPYVETATSFAKVIDDDTPVVCYCWGGDGRTIGYNLSHTLGRPVQQVAPQNRSYYLVTQTTSEYAPGTTPLLKEWRYGLWRIDPAAAIGDRHEPSAAPVPR